MACVKRTNICTLHCSIVLSVGWWLFCASACWCRLQLLGAIPVEKQAGVVMWMSCLVSIYWLQEPLSCAILFVFTSRLVSWRPILSGLPAWSCLCLNIPLTSIESCVNKAALIEAYVQALCKFMLRTGFAHRWHIGNEHCAGLPLPLLSWPFTSPLCILTELHQGHTNYRWAGRWAVW